MNLITPRPFCNVDRGVRLREQRLAPDAERIAGGNADAARYADRLAESGHAHVSDPLHDALRNRSCRGGVGTPR